MPVTNLLSQSSSAYLRSAAHQPIQWHEFGPEAFERARQLDRPILLDVGAVWCHWCHVIDRESYEDADIAAYINEHYIPIKVDRDQRPDVDARYQSVVMQLSGQGGWPLTAFLTYDGRLIYGGTYFPPQTMKTLLRRVVDIYREKKDEILKPDTLLTAEAVSAQTADVESAEEAYPALDADAVEDLLESARQAFDPMFGGFGRAPKFPHFSMLSLFIVWCAAHPEATHDREILVKTLRAMADGGVYDQVAGGFHRYSVDREWHVPHFEKMSYDNGEALGVYAEAYRLTREPRFMEAVDGILDWVAADLCDAERGGFYASQDADINLDDDGDHFTWTLDELRALLSPSEASLLIHACGMTPQGDMHERPGRNVLWRMMPIPEAAQALGIPVDVAYAEWSWALSKLKAARAQRTIPYIDPTLYTNWNGMLIDGHLRADALLSRPQARERALRALDRMLSEHVRPEDGTVLHAVGVPGFLEDVAWLLRATLSAYQSTLEDRYLMTAQSLAKHALATYEDPVHGGFFDTPVPGDDALGLLKLRRKPVEDNPSASANAVLIRALQQLALLTDDPCYSRSAERALRWAMAGYSRYGYYVAALGLAAWESLNPPLKLDLVGHAEPSLWALAQEAFFPGKLLKRVPGEGVTEVRVCLGTRCLAPVFAPDTLREQLEILQPGCLT